jgi:hypothetical protein
MNFKWIFNGKFTGSRARLPRPPLMPNEDPKKTCEKPQIRGSKAKTWMNIHRELAAKSLTIVKPLE